MARILADTLTMVMDMSIAEEIFIEIEGQKQVLERKVHLMVVDIMEEMDMTEEREFLTF